MTFVPAFRLRAVSMTLALTGALLLSACSAPPPPDEQEQVGTQAKQAADQATTPPADKPIEAPPVGSCDATQVQTLVGQTLTDALGKQAVEDAGAQQLRVLKPNQPVTMEFNGNRLNIEVDAHNVVASVRCG